MAWPTDAEVQAAVLGILTKGVSGDAGLTIPTGLAGIVSDSNRAGQADLTRILALKGYTPAQIASWDDRYAYGIDQATYWALVRSGGMAAFEDKFAERLDRREELQNATAILIGGAPVAPPTGGEVGGIASGTLDYYAAAQEATEGWFA